MTKLIRPFLVINVVIFLGFAAAFWFWLEPLAAMLGIGITNVTAAADLRSVYGGLPFGVGIVLVASLRRPAWEEPALLLILGCTVGLLAGWTLTFLMDGTNVDAIIFIVFGIEVVTLVLCVLLWRALRARPSS